MHRGLGNRGQGDMGAGYGGQVPHGVLMRKLG